MARDIPRWLADTLTQIRLEATRGLRRGRFLVFGVALPLVFYIAYHVAGVGSATDGLLRPVPLAALAPVVPSYRLADLGWTALAGRAPNPVDVVVLAGYTVAFGAVAVWRKRSEGSRVGDSGHTNGGAAVRRPVRRDLPW